MNVIIVGGGKIGFYLSKTLLEHGHHPIVIEKHRNICEQIANQLDIPTYCGDGSSLDTLMAAGAADADVLVGVTGMDQDNLITCQVAKQKFHTPRTIARVNNPKNMEVMKQLGVDIPISSTDNIARLVEREIDVSHFRRLISLNRGEASINELVLPDDSILHGKRLMELQLPSECVIVSITRDGNFIIPRGNTQLMANDKIIFVSQNTVLHDVQMIMGI